MEAWKETSVAKAGTRDVKDFRRGFRFALLRFAALTCAKRSGTREPQEDISTERYQRTFLLSTDIDGS